MGAPETLWTIHDVATHLGVKPSSARGTLSRWKVRPVEHRIDSGRAYSLYDPEEVQEAAANRPGRGARTDLDQKSVPPIQICGVLYPANSTRYCTLPPGHRHAVHQTATGAQWPV